MLIPDRDKISAFADMICVLSVIDDEVTENDLDGVVLTDLINNNITAIGNIAFIARYCENENVKEKANRILEEYFYFVKSQHSWKDKVIIFFGKILGYLIPKKVAQNYMQNNR